ncbi:MAG: TatD family hydrolase [Anaerolineae bacterium]
MQLCDSHCHLESSRFELDRAVVIERARQAGVDLMITCGSDLETSRQEINLAAEYRGVHAAVGIHGHRANTALTGPETSSSLAEDVILELGKLAAHPGVVALGELGLDYHYEFSPKSVQKMVLAAQLELAQQLDLPVILHNRESDDDLMQIVEHTEVRGVLHCFLGSSELLDWAIARGFYIGIAGPVTFPRVDSLLEMVKRIPLEHLLIETDSPYLAPQPVRGKRNEPANVHYVAEKVSQVLGLSPMMVAKVTRNNAQACFRIADAG